MELLVVGIPWYRREDWEELRGVLSDARALPVSYGVLRRGAENVIDTALREAANGAMKGILGYTEEELVSVDIVREPLSGIVYANATAVVGRLARILVWYDNEVGYGARCLDVVGRPDF